MVQFARGGTVPSTAAALRGVAEYVPEQAGSSAEVAVDVLAGGVVVAGRTQPPTAAATADAAKHSATGFSMPRAPTPVRFSGAVVRVCTKIGMASGQPER